MARQPNLALGRVRRRRRAAGLADEGSRADGPAGKALGRASRPTFAQLRAGTALVPTLGGRAVRVLGSGMPEPDRRVLADWDGARRRLRLTRAATRWRPNHRTR